MDTSVQWSPGVECHVGALVLSESIYGMFECRFIPDKKGGPLDKVCLFCGKKIHTSKACDDIHDACDNQRYAAVGGRLPKTNTCANCGKRKGRIR